MENFYHQKNTMETKTKILTWPGKYPKHNFNIQSRSDPTRYWAVGCWDDAGKESFCECPWGRRRGKKKKECRHIDIMRKLLIIKLKV